MGSRTRDALQEVFPGLYLGGWRAEQDETNLNAHQITHVLQVAREVSPSHQGRYDYMHLPMQDEDVEDLVAILPQAHEYIENALSQGGRVLVHCMAGVSRSAAVVVAYIMCANKAPYEATLAAVTQLRRCVCPNDGFRLQLTLLEEAGWQLRPWDGWTAARFQLEYKKREDPAAAPRPRKHSFWQRINEELVQCNLSNARLGPAR